MFRVLILFLLANFAKFFAGSIPKTFFKPLFINGFSATPSLLPISIIKDFFFQFELFNVFICGVFKMISKTLRC